MRADDLDTIVHGNLYREFGWYSKNLVVCVWADAKGTFRSIDKDSGTLIKSPYVWQNEKLVMFLTSVESSLMTGGLR